MVENNENRKHERAPYRAKLKIKFPSFPKFLERYSKDISEGGMFIFSKNPKPKGTIIRFEIIEHDESVLLRGEGEVKWVREYDPADPAKEPGMGIEFTELAQESRSLVKRIVEEKLNESKSCGGGGVARQEKGKPPQGGPSRDDRISTDDISKMIDQAQREDRESLDTLKTKGFFKEEIPLKEEPVKAFRTGAPVVGIDLGTTFSCVGYVKDGKPIIIPSKKGYRTLPSIVAYPNEDEVIIGQDAKPYLITDPQSTIYGSKRMLGRKFRSNVISQMRNYFRYKIVENTDGDVAVEIKGKKYELPIISSLILRELKSIAEDHFGMKVSTAVITVPAYYNNRQREAVKEAGKLAGFDVKRIVNEPTAAALAYGLDKGLNEKVLIYDLGGGTFDVSVMDISNNVFEVLASGGDSFLGGIDFDNRITDHIAEMFKKTTGVDIKNNMAAMQRLREAAEKAKIDLSSQAQTKVNVPFITGDEKERRDLALEVSRNDLENITRDLVNRTIQICQEVLRIKKLKRDDIDQIILVGGQTRMPLVSETLERIFGKAPKKGVHPDEVVAMGAALLADTFDKVDSVVLLDSLSIPIGVGLQGGRFKPIIPKNTRIPFEKTFSLSTVKDDQTVLEIDIFQGETDTLEQCEYLGTFVVDDIPKAKKGESKTILTFSLNSECILTLKAKESLSGRTVEKQMVVKETPEAVKKQFEKEMGSS